MTTVFFGITTRSFHYDRTIGRDENSGSGFRNPQDVAVAPGGRLYVLNRLGELHPENNHVTMLTPDEEYIGQFGSIGEGDGEFVWGSAIALDSNQNVYLTDEWLHRVSVFDREGSFLDKWGTPGSGDGQINKPASIVLDGEDNAYVADAGNHRVQKFTKDGKFLTKWGGLGSGEGEFNLPWGVATDIEGKVYVADWRNDRIQKFTSDGQFLAAFGSSGSGIAEFNRPTDVVVDKEGDIYVADCFNDRVQVLTSDGRHITTFAGDAGLSRLAREKLDVNPGMVRQRSLVRDLGPERRFWRPKGLAIDEEGRIVIVDCYRSRLQVYQKDNY